MDQYCITMGSAKMAWRGEVSVSVAGRRRRRDVERVIVPEGLWSMVVGIVD